MVWKNPERDYPCVVWENIPKDIKGLLVHYVYTYDKLEDIVSSIQATSLTNKELNNIINKVNPKGFAALMHMLADKFGKTTEAVAEKFGIPATKRI